MYDDELKTKENKNWTKDEIEPQHIYGIYTRFPELVACYLHLLCSYWFIGLFTTVVIGQGNYFHFSFTTPNCALKMV